MIEILGACVEKILSQASPQEIAQLLEDVDPYPGAVEFLEGIKSYEYETYIITDNPLAGLAEIKEVLKEKLPVEEIYSTTQIDEETLTIKGYVPKSEIFKTIYENFDSLPKKLLGVVQGKNDIPLAYEIKRYDGILIVANSNSKELKKLADYCVASTGELPKILEKIEL